MKILVRLFLIILVMFSYVWGSEAAMKALYDSKIKEYQQMISSQQSTVVLFKERAKKDIAHKERWLNMSKDFGNKAKASSSQLINLKNDYQKSASDVYKTLYNEHVKKIESRISSFKRIPVWFLRDKERRLKQAENELSTLNSAYSVYLKSLDAQKTQVVGTTKNIGNEIHNDSNKILPLKTATDSNSKTMLSTSNLNTNTNINNISVSTNSKANVGGISVGKDDKEKE